MTIVFEDGFESGSLAGYALEQVSGGIIAITTERFHTGAYSVKSTTPGGFSGVNIAQRACIRKTIDGAPAELFFRTYIYLAEGIPNAVPPPIANQPYGLRFIQAFGNINTGQTVLSFGIETFNGVPSWMLAGWNVTAMKYLHGDVPALGRWYLVEVRIRCGVTGQMTAWIDEVQVMDSTLDTSSVALYLTSFRVGMSGHNMIPPSVSYLDDLAVGDAYIGPVITPPPLPDLRIFYSSTPLSVPANINGVPIQSGGVASVPLGALVILTVPSGVTV